MFRAFSDYLTPIYKSLNKVLDVNDPTLELEVRIGEFKDGSFDDNLDRIYFNRVKNNLSPLAYEKVIDSIDGNEDISLKKRSIGAELDFFQRENVKIINLENYGLKMLVNKQTDIRPTELNEELRRTKDCWFFEKDDCLVLLTKVDHVTFKDNQVGEKYEIEIKTKLNNDKFVDLLENILRFYYDTEEVWSMNDRNKVIAMFTKKGRLSAADFTQPRAMLWDDLTYDVLINNPHCLHHKVDGFRKILVFNETGIWLVGPNGDFNLVTVSSFEEIIIDAEFIPKDSRREGAPNAKYWLICYDRIVEGINNYFERLEMVRDYISGIKNSDLLYLGMKKVWRFKEDNFFKVIQEAVDQTNLLYKTDGLIFNPIIAPYQRHKDRVYQSTPDDVIKWKPSQLLTIDFRIRILPITSELKLYTRGFEDFAISGLINKVDDPSKLEINSVYKFNLEIANNRLITVYKIRDGYTMTRKQLESKFERIRELKQRNINGKISDDALKELGNITFKLRVVNINDKVELAVSELAETEFMGTREYPLSKANILSNNLNSEFNDYIVEFKFSEGKLVPYKLRNDKIMPNNTMIAEITWNMLNDPITEDIISGREGGLLRKSQLRFINKINYDHFYDFSFFNNADGMKKMSNYKNVVILDWDYHTLIKVNEKQINGYSFIVQSEKILISSDNKTRRALDLTSLILNSFKMDTYRSDYEKLLNEQELKLAQLQLIIRISNPKPRTEIIRRNQNQRFNVAVPDVGLEVALPYQDGAVKFETAADNDDLSFLTPEDYMSGVVSISSINNSWFHCFVKAIYSEYQNNNEAALRLNIVAKLRRDLAILLALTDKKYYDIAAYYIPNMSRDQMIDYMNSTQELEIEFIYLMAYIFQVNIYVIEIPYQIVMNTRIEFNYDKIVILERFRNNNYHLVAKSKDGLISTLFTRKDEFVKMLEAM